MSDQFTLIDDFSTGWAVTIDVGTVTTQDETTNNKTGTASQLLTIGDGTAVTDQGRLKKTGLSVDMDGGLGDPRSVMIKAFGDTGQALASNFFFRVEFRSSPTDFLTTHLVGQGGKFGAADQIGPRWNNFVATDQDGTQWAVTGTPDYSNITEIHVFVSKGAAYAGINPHIVTFDSVYSSHEIKRTKGIFTVCFDDSDAVQRDMADRLKSRYGWNVTLYNIFDRIDTGGLTTADLTYLKGQGNELQVHGGGSSHSGDNWVEQVDNGASEIQDLLDYYTTNSFMPPELHASYPEGAANDAVISVLDLKNIITARTIPGVPFNVVGPVDQSKNFLMGNHTVDNEISDQWMLQCVSMISAGTRSTVETTVDNIVNIRGGWTMAFSHGWPFTATPGTPDLVEFDAFFDQIQTWEQAGLLEVMTVSKAWIAIQNLTQRLTRDITRNITRDITRNITE